MQLKNKILFSLLILDIPDNITQRPRLDLTVTQNQSINVFHVSQCPCAYRRKNDKNYICWGVRCPLVGLHDILDEDPLEFSDVDDL